MCVVDMVVTDVCVDMVVTDVCVDMVVTDVCVDMVVTDVCVDSAGPTKQLAGAGLHHLTAEDWLGATSGHQRCH